MGDTEKQALCGAEFIPTRIGCTKQPCHEGPHKAGTYVWGPDESSGSNPSNDLVPELREHAAFYKGVERPAEYICNKAAEGVEKLAAELYGAETMVKHAVLNEAELRAEIERLTRELQGTKDDLYSVDKAAKELGAERDRLRAALERISLLSNTSRSCLAATGCVAKEFAREALRGAVQVRVNCQHLYVKDFGTPYATCTHCGASVQPDKTSGGT